MKSGKLIFAGASVAALLAAATGIAFADSGGPTVVLSSSASSTTNLSSIPITATFSEPVTGFSSGGITATNGGISAFSGSGATYTFDLNPSAQGATTVMIPANAGVNASSTGNQASNTLTFNEIAGTSTPPTATTTAVISNITVSGIHSSDVTINWTTDTPASSQVFYGPTLFYGASTTEADMGGVTSHTQTLYGLTPSTLYNFYVSSANNAGTATSSNMTFTTAATSTSTGTSTASTTPLSIDNITTDRSNGIADNSFADGWQWTIHFTVPTNEDAFRIRFSDWGNASNSFATANDLQIYSPQSSNASSSGSAILETGNGNSDWIYLNDDTSSSTPGRQIDLVVQVKIPFGTANGSYSSNFTAETFPSSATSTAI